MLIDTNMGKTVKEKLALLIEKHFQKEGRISCEPRNLRRNYSTQLSDYCSWSGTFYINGTLKPICSWETMTDIVKSKGFRVINTFTGEICSQQNKTHAITPTDTNASE